MNELAKRRIKKRTKKRGWVFRICLLLIVFYIGGIFIDQRIKLHSLNKERTELQKQAKQLKKEISGLEQDMKNADDPAYIEKTAREDLKMVKSNEIVYIDTNRTEYILQKKGEGQ